MLAYGISAAAIGGLVAFIWRRNAQIRARLSAAERRSEDDASDRSA
ncbi:MAG: heme exporter protein CcmD [Pseudomonadota bacterium]